VDVASSIGTPARSHWYERLSASGDQEPEATVRVSPTVVVPEMVGVGLVEKGSRTGPVSRLVTDADMYPYVVPVTDRVITEPASAGCNTYVAEVAPSMATPARSHW
jgi:hypothetical protein